ncbi:MAG: NUDIX hydrolase [Blautia sp.]|nr:NUDIX hydrolase [Blautia sp.]MDD7730466.1 NUDIX hydrolase [Clostridia bacterium]MDY5664721.1 NUDIX hydrolase [Blautia sp.]
MGKINSIEKLTDNRFVNLYNVKATSVHDTPVNYFVASRAKSIETMKISTRKNTPDGVIIYSVYGEKHDKVVLIRQYRYTLGDYIYEFPAGLVEPDENYHEGAIRELYEETGLTLKPIEVDEAYQKPYFTTVGMTDESCATVYGYASGEVSASAQEDTEEIEVVLADREEVKRILREENVAIMCAYMLMHFLQDEEPFAFLNGMNRK